jgi:hypothetical protein
MLRNAGSTGALLEEIDNNGGVAPNSWIVATKNVPARRVFREVQTHAHTNLGSAGRGRLRQVFKDRAAQPATFASFFSVLEQVTGYEVRSVAHHDWLVVLRAMIAQGVRLRVNKECRETIEKGASSLA